MIDCEHFFDGYKANRDYALACADAACAAGCLCDTNGGTMPDEVDIVSDVTKQIGGENLGIHTHNDTENAVANSWPRKPGRRARLTDWANAAAMPIWFAYPHPAVKAGLCRALRNRHCARQATASEKRVALAR